MKTKSTIGILLVLFSFIQKINANFSTPDSYTNPKAIITIGSSNYSSNGENDSAVFQKAINDVHTAGGGHVIVPSGQYRIMEIQMLSNVHVIFKSNVTIYPAMEALKWKKGEKEKQERILKIEQEFRTGNLFNFGRDNRIVNASLIGALGNTVFNFTGIKTGLRVVYLGDCKNFRIANIKVNDEQSIFSVIILSWGGPVSYDKYGYAGLVWSGIAKENPGFPENGLIENITALDSNYGYGTVQAHSGTNIHFRNIDCEGGVAVRLETGIKEMNLARVGGLFNIKIEDVISRKGQGAIFLQPHTMRHGNVYARNVSSYGSEFAVSIGSPFVSSKKYGENSGLSPGIFTSITIDGVKAVYSDGPIITRTAHLSYYPQELHGMLTKIGTRKGADHTGPSIAAISNMRGKEQKVAITNIEAIGFKYHPDIITKTNLFKGEIQFHN